jgi:hypothetical protein
MCECGLSTVCEDELADRVEAGALFLDENNPGWEASIRTAELDLGNIKSCVFGQLYGDYEEALESLNWTDDNAAGMGFFVPTHDDYGDPVPDTTEQYQVLTRLWLDAVYARRP